MGLVSGKKNNIGRLTICSGGALNIHTDRQLGTPGNRTREKAERIKLVFNVPANRHDRGTIFTKNTNYGTN